MTQDLDLSSKIGALWLRELEMDSLWIQRETLASYLSQPTPSDEPVAQVTPLPLPENESMTTSPITSPPIASPITEKLPLIAEPCAPLLSWASLTEKIQGCQKCSLHAQRKQAVVGNGDQQANILIVGEAPGAEEDEQGLPFVGQSGQLLDHILAAIGRSRQHDIYIANVIKCRPPENRTPFKDEIRACQFYLEQQIQLLKPTLIVALGKTAGEYLLGEPIKSMANIRGKIFQYFNTPLVITYHPSYLLRSSGEKLKAWEDFIFIRQQLEQLDSDARLTK